jgi:hypothetical protein
VALKEPEDPIETDLKDSEADRTLDVSEVREQILKRAVSPPERLGDLFVKVFGPDRGVDLELPLREPHEPEFFDT